MNQRKKTLKKDQNKAERLIKGSASPLKQSNLPSTASPKQPAESSNALKSLLGVQADTTTTSEAKFAASPAVSQSQPNHQPPAINGNNLLQQLFASSTSSNQQSPRQQQPQQAQYSPQQQYMQHPQQYVHHQQVQQQQQQHPQQQNDILQQLQQASMMQQRQPQQPQNANAHRASFVEELLKANKGSATDMSSISPVPTTSSDNLRRNSLLSVLQGRPKEQTPPAQPTNNLLEAFMKQQQADYYSYAE